MILNINKHIFFTSLLLCGCILLFEFSNIDIIVQDFMYNFTQKSWLLSKEDKILKLIFYNGIKTILIIFAFCILFSLIFLKRKDFVKKHKKALIVIFLSLLFVPLSISSLKTLTNMPCPKNLTRYDGAFKITKLFDKRTFKGQKCYPAGHASGGFALLSLIFLFKNKKSQKLSLVFALFISWCMGLYKMLIGDHFLSHTISTMLVAWILILCIYKCVNYFIKQPQ